MGTSGLAAAEALSEDHTSGRYPAGPRSVSNTIAPGQSGDALPPAPLPVGEEREQGG